MVPRGSDRGIRMNVVGRAVRSSHEAADASRCGPRGVKTSDVRGPVTSQAAVA